MVRMFSSRIRRLIAIAVSLLVALTVIQVVFILMPGDDRDAVAKLNSWGVDYQRRSRAPIPSLLLGTSIFEYGPVWVIRYQGAVDHEVMDVFVSAPRLRHLVLYNGSSLGKEELCRLEALRSLEELTLLGVGLKDDDYVYVSRIPRLKTLILSEPSLTDNGLKNLQSAKHLHLLMLGEDSKITQPALDAFRASRPGVYVNVPIPNNGNLR